MKLEFCLFVVYFASLKPTADVEIDGFSITTYLFKLKAINMFRKQSLADHPHGRAVGSKELVFMFHADDAIRLVDCAFPRALYRLAYQWPLPQIF